MSFPDRFGTNIEERWNDFAEQFRGISDMKSKQTPDREWRGIWV